MTTTETRPVWSKSGYSSFQECQRKYAFSTQTPSASGEESPVEKLKKLKNRYLWSGATVHEAIGDILKNIRQGGPPEDSASIIEKVKNQMRDQFRSSLRDVSSSSKLFEHAYNRPVTKDVWTQNWLGVENSLKWFLQSDWYKRFQSLGPECWKTVDEVLSFDVEGIKSYVKIDCAIEANGKMILIDWKTSSLKNEDSNNLFVAALYAHEVWEAFPENIECYSVSLKDGKSRKILVDENALMEAHLRIQEESSQLQSGLEQIGEDPYSAPMTTHLGHCLRCNFQKLCHPNGLGS